MGLGKSPPDQAAAAVQEGAAEAPASSAEADLDAGRYVKETVAQHIRRINKLNSKLVA